VAVSDQIDLCVKCQTWICITHSRKKPLISVVLCSTRLSYAPVMKLFIQLKSATCMCSIVFCQAVAVT